MVSRFVLGLALAVMVTIPLGATDATAQIPDKFENLKMLPSDIGKQDLVGVMRNFSTSLGVRCNECHVGENPNDLSGYDFASDDKKNKRVAREMMKMVDEINAALRANTEIEDVQEVRCVTCHRGVEHPQTLDRVMLKSVKKDGGEAAIEKYRMLRTKYYGSGSYDFTPRTLNAVAQQLGDDPEQIDTAIALMQLSLEFDPDQASSYVLLGQLQASKGDKETAVASINKALEIDPDNRWAKRLLQSLTSEE